MKRFRLLPLLALLLPAATVLAQPTAPPPPAEYDARIRYQIDAYRNERLEQFEPLVKYLASVGFKKAEGPVDEAENPRVTHMKGTVTAAGARKLLVPRQVRTVLLVPKGTVLPAEAEPVRVQIELTSGLTPDRQRVLADQVRGVLAGLGFKEAVGYDTRGNTRLVGMVPVKALDVLLEDLRRVQGAEEVPPPFRSTTPVRLVEVLDSEPTRERPAPAAVPKGQELLTPDLRELVANEAEAAKPVRLEVILSRTPAPEDRGFVKLAERVIPGSRVEGRLGPLFTVYATAKDAVTLGELPGVSTVRLARSGQPRPGTVGAAKGDSTEALLYSGLDRLHALGRKGKGHLVVLLDGDFRGWEALVGKKLPPKTTLIDLTAERNRDVMPDAYPGDAAELGHGTRMALAAALAAPLAELILVRVDPYAPHMVEEVARALAGEPIRTLSLDHRLEEIDDDRASLERRRDDLLRERRILAPQISLNPDVSKNPAKYGLDPRFEADKELLERQKKYVDNQAAWDRDEQSVRDRTARLAELVRRMRDLKGVTIVCSSLLWLVGHPVDGSSPLSRWFDDRKVPPLLWFQSAGNARGQAWNGAFRDADGNGVMEFVPPGTPLKAGKWSPELNFLAWAPAGKEVEADLPAGTDLRLSVQWREAHDPDVSRDGDQAYRAPLADLKLVLLRQLDPKGAKRPSDDLEVVAQSYGLPQRLLSAPAWATYEQTLRFVVKEPGRYVLRLEGRVPPGTRPVDEPTVPAAVRYWELRPRLFVQTFTGPGRVVFEDFATDLGTLGMPADARRIISVGAADGKGQRQPYSAGGPPANLELLPKPDVMAPDTLELDGAEGTGTSAGFAAGLAASAMSAGMPAGRFLDFTTRYPGDVIRAPKGGR